MGMALAEPLTGEVMLIWAEALMKGAHTMRARIDAARRIFLGDRITGLLDLFETMIVIWTTNVSRNSYAGPNFAS
jgi:hypothetical protein